MSHVFLDARSCYAAKVKNHLNFPIKRKFVTSLISATLSKNLLGLKDQIFFKCRHKVSGEKKQESERQRRRWERAFNEGPYINAVAARQNAYQVITFLRFGRRSETGASRLETSCETGEDCEARVTLDFSLNYVSLFLYPECQRKMYNTRSSNMCAKNNEIRFLLLWHWNSHRNSSATAGKASQ